MIRIWSNVSRAPLKNVNRSYTPCYHPLLYREKPATLVRKADLRNQNGTMSIC